MSVTITSSTFWKAGRIARRCKPTMEARFQGALVDLATKVEIVARNAQLYTMSGQEHIGPPNKAWDLTACKASLSNFLKPSCLRTAIRPDTIGILRHELKPHLKPPARCRPIPVML